jgi:hypothetical protein
MKASSRRRALQTALYAFIVAALLFGCRGAVDRTFFDDEADTTGAAAQVEDGTVGPIGDSSSETGDDDDAADAASDAPADSLDAADATEAGVPRTVGGTVLGLVGTGMVLRLNGANDLPVNPADGGNVAFTFLKTLTEGEDFAVTIPTQPASQQCTVSGGDGTIGSGNVTTIVVNCFIGKYTIGGDITGLEGTITLHNNGGDAVTLNNSGSFSFPTPLDDLAQYAVSISSHSALPEQTCILTDETGNVAGANVTNIGIACTTKSYDVSGVVSGIEAGTLFLSNGPDSLQVTGNGPFTFGQKVLSNRDYDVKVTAAPAGKTCPVTNGSGTVTTFDITNVDVKCVPQFALTQNFDGVTAPSLPAGWTTARLDTGGGNPSLFVAVNAASGQLPAPHSAPNAAHVTNGAQIAEIALVSPAFTVETSNAKLTFRHAHALEAAFSVPTLGYDGVVLEYSTNNGATWNDIGTANFTAGGYTRTLSSDFDNALGGRQAWSGWSTPGAWVTSTVNLPLTAGQSARIRFVLSTDKRNVDCDAALNRACIGFRLDTLSIAN